MSEVTPAASSPEIKDPTAEDIPSALTEAEKSPTLNKTADEAYQAGLEAAAAAEVEEE